VGYLLMMEANDSAMMVGISDRAYRVLLIMAHRAKDKGTADMPARHYYGGYRYLAIQLGYDVPSGGELPRAPKLAVQRAVSELIAAKLIEHRGRTDTNRSAYYLRLWSSGE
jgi:hypothetical protein